MVSSKFFYSVAHDLCLPGRFFDYGNCTRARYATALSVAEVHKNDDSSLYELLEFEDI